MLAEAALIPAEAAFIAKTHERSPSRLANLYWVLLGEQLEFRRPALEVDPGLWVRLFHVSMSSSHCPALAKVALQQAVC